MKESRASTQTYRWTAVGSSFTAAGSLLAGTNQHGGTAAASYTIALLALGLVVLSVIMIVRGKRSG